MNASARHSVIDARGLCVRFGDLSALDNVSFSVKGRSITGLVGPNGAGKTTLIRVLATLLLPDSGAATVGGFDVVEKASKVRGIIGYLPDFTGIYLDMRVDEYLRFFSDAHGLGRKAREQFMNHALELSGLRQRAHSFIEELSRGMRSKLSFVRALAGDPKLLLLDEPLSNLDPVARSEMLAIISRMREEGKSILISSHIISDLEKLCDNVLFIHTGRLIKERDSGEGTGLVYELRLSRETVAAVDSLESFEEIDSVKPLAGKNRFRLLLCEDAEPAVVLRKMVESGLDVLEWKPVKLSLEERLVRAVTEDGK